MTNEGNEKSIVDQFIEDLRNPYFYIPISIGLLLIIPIFLTTDEYWKVTLTGLSSILIGIGVTYYGIIISDRSKSNKLMIQLKDMEKEDAVKQKELEILAKSTVETMKVISLNILKQCNKEKRNFNPVEESILQHTQQVIKSFENQYKPDFTSDLSDLKRMAGTDSETKIKKENYESWLSPYGVLNDVTGSATLDSVLLNTGKTNSNEFVGSSSNKPTFKHDS